MKAFLCALSVFILLSCIVTVNAIYVQRKTDDLADTIDALPQNASEQDIDRIREKWETLEPTINYSVSHGETDQITDALAELEAYRGTEETEKYHAARQRLLDLMHRLSKSEGFSFDNIF